MLVEDQFKTVDSLKDGMLFKKKINLIAPLHAKLSWLITVKTITNHMGSPCS